MKKLVAVLHGESQVEYDRTQQLPDHQLKYLDIMDAKMDEGIPHGAGHIFAPDTQQKAQFVANQLINAIKTENEQLAAATLAYLALRLPDLQRLKRNASGCQSSHLLKWIAGFEAKASVCF